MTLVEELDQAAALASQHARDDDVVSAVLATEPTPGHRVYLCAFDGADGCRSWLALGGEGDVLTERRDLREAVSIAALCEVAEDAAGGGDLADLISSLEELRARENPPGIDGAIDAARRLQEVLGSPPQLASPERLDEIGAATRRLEHELQPTAISPFGAAMQSAQAAVSELQREIEGGYRAELVK